MQSLSTSVHCAKQAYLRGSKSYSAARAWMPSALGRGIRRPAPWAWDLKCGHWMRVNNKTGSRPNGWSTVSTS